MVVAGDESNAALGICSILIFLDFEFGAQKFSSNMFHILSKRSNAEACLGKFRLLPKQLHVIGVHNTATKKTSFLCDLFGK